MLRTRVNEGKTCQVAVIEAFMKAQKLRVTVEKPTGEEETNIVRLTDLKSDANRYISRQVAKNQPLLQTPFHSLPSMYTYFCFRVPHTKGEYSISPSSFRRHP